MNGILSIIRARPVIGRNEIVGEYRERSPNSMPVSNVRASGLISGPGSDDNPCCRL